MLTSKQALAWHWSEALSRLQKLPPTFLQKLPSALARQSSAVEFWRWSFSAPSSAPRPRRRAQQERQGSEVCKEVVPDSQLSYCVQRCPRDESRPNSSFARAWRFNSGIQIPVMYVLDDSIWWFSTSLSHFSFWIRTDTNSKRYVVDKFWVQFSILSIVLRISIIAY